MKPARNLLWCASAAVGALLICSGAAQAEGESPDSSCQSETLSPVPGSPVTRHASSVAVPPSLRPIIGGEEGPIAERFRSVRALGEHLSEAEILALYAFLKSPPQPEETNLQGLHALKNDMLNVLRHQATAPAGLTANLINLYRDPAQDCVIRDYALQHLVAWYEQGAADAPDAKADIRAVLRDAVQDHRSLAGTALLGMHRLSAEHAAFDAAEIDSLALSLARSAGTDPAARVTAIQVCAERGLKEALPVINTFAQTGENIALRLSAIAALGRLGATEQANMLRRLESGPEDALRAALRAAMRQLQQKEQLF
jgi:hypothetical protein